MATVFGDSAPCVNRREAAQASLAHQGGQYHCSKFTRGETEV